MNGQKAYKMNVASSPKTFLWGSDYPFYRYCRPRRRDGNGCVADRMDAACYDQ